MRRGTLAALAFLTAGLGSAAPADATVTIGSNLGRAIDQEIDCGASSCTQVQSALPAGSAVVGRFASPVSGTIVAWRIRAGADTPAAALRTVTPLGGGLYTGRATSAFVNPPPNATTSFPAQLPVRNGDLLGLRVGGAPADYYFAGGGTMLSYQPVLADGEPGRAPGSTSSREIAINADVEPTAAFEHGRLRRQGSRRAKIKVTVPNPGELSVGSPRGGVFRRKFVQLEEAGTVAFKPMLTGRARRALERDGRLGVRLFLSFRPIFGEAAAIERVKATLRR